MSFFQLSRRSNAKAKQLRRQGIIPVGLVEKNHETLPLQITQQEFKEATHHGGGHMQVDFKIEGEKDSRKAILKQIHLDPLGKHIESITLQEVSMDDTVKMDLPIVPTGENEAAKEGGVTLTLVTDHVKVRGKVSDLPEAIQVDVSEIPAGGTITASEIQLPEGLELLNSPDTIIFSNTIDKEPELAADQEEMAAEGVPDDAAETDASPGE